MIDFDSKIALLSVAQWKQKTIQIHRLDTMYMPLQKAIGLRLENDAGAFQEAGASALRPLARFPLPWTAVQW
jgi:hypothetical protein